MQVLNSQHKTDFNNSQVYKSTVVRITMNSSASSLCFPNLPFVLLIGHYSPFYFFQCSLPFLSLFTTLFPQTLQLVLWSFCDLTQSESQVSSLVQGHFTSHQNVSLLLIRCIECCINYESLVTKEKRELPRGIYYGMA